MAKVESDTPPFLHPRRPEVVNRGLQAAPESWDTTGSVLMVRLTMLRPDNKRPGRRSRMATLTQSPTLLKPLKCQSAPIKSTGAFQMYTAQEIADYILWTSHESGATLSNLKLQKLLYYVQSWHLALNHESLFPEKFEAWAHGPAIPEIYRRYRQFSWRGIDEDVQKPSLDATTADFVEEVLDEYGHLDARRLEYLTHREQPWIEARNGASDGEPCTGWLDERLMESFYGARMAEERAEKLETMRVEEEIDETARHDAELLKGEIGGEEEQTNLVPY